MSGIAKILKHQGYCISGCDLDLEQKSVRDLIHLGCPVYCGNNTLLCHDNSIDILVYSSDIKQEHPEIARARERGIPTIPRALMLAELMRMKYSIAIAGAHGKTTTTSLVSHVLMEAHYDPTVIIGGHLKSISTNARLGNGDFLVAEADESDRSLVRLSPTIAIVTNLDREHLDTYRDLDDIKDTFRQFLGNLPFYGKAIICHDDANARSLLPLNHTKAITYGLSAEADVFGHDVTLKPTHSTCTVWSNREQKMVGELTLHMPGRHNLLNALAATTLSLELDVPFEQIAQALANFKGVDRRFTFKGMYKGAEIFDDYGHHPAEIHNTLLVARQRARKKLIVVFQPHRYTRTFHLWDDFINVLTNHDIDHLLITDIYPASESAIPTINSARLVRELQAHKKNLAVEYVSEDEHLTGLQEILTSIVSDDDLILLLGAGKVNKLATTLQARLPDNVHRQSLHLEAV